MVRGQDREITGDLKENNFCGMGVGRGATLEWFQR